MSAVVLDTNLAVANFNYISVAKRMCASLFDLSVRVKYSAKYSCTSSLGSTTDSI